MRRPHRVTGFVVCWLFGSDTGGKESLSQELWLADKGNTCGLQWSDSVKRVTLESNGDNRVSTSTFYKDRKLVQLSQRSEKAYEGSFLMAVFHDNISTAFEPSA